MFWNQIKKDIVQGDDKEEEEEIKEIENLQPENYDIQVFKSTFKYFFEERMWNMAKMQVDFELFNQTNFNQIVKKTLLERIRNQKQKIDERYQINKKN